jgi:tungstate transport system permease protein
VETFISALHLLIRGDAELWHIIFVSLSTTLISLAIVTPLALISAYGLASRRFLGRRVLIGLLQTSLSFPTVLIGLLLYLLLSRQGYLGAWQWLFTQKAIIVGQILIALPILLALSLSALQAADPRIKETAISLGASKWRVMWTLLLEVRFALIAAILTGFGRVISEVGCALMVGGNIAGETRTMTTAIALETSKGNFAQGIALGLVLMLLALVINVALMYLQGDAAETGRGH